MTPKRSTAVLIAGGWQPEQDLHFEIVPGALHDENAWAARFPQVLEFLFPAAPTSASDKAQPKTPLQG